MSDQTTAPKTADRRHGHIPSAVAIKHDGPVEAQAKIIAKGRGGVAEQILQLAYASGVKVREDADLVEILEAIEIDSDVPLEALATVAEILSYVYRANAGTDPRQPDTESKTNREPYEPN